ncbi:hypothetical protein [Sphingobacterium sp. Mn56C]|uniref:hypothetical protein n=1 Tax=Sphingobacterium sp. Mn56C TaxID=3395261 RepID=UPI003BF54533
MICFIFAFESFIHWRWQRINLTKYSYYEISKINPNRTIFNTRNTTYLHVVSNALLRLSLSSMLKEQSAIA